MLVVIVAAAATAVGDGGGVIVVVVCSKFSNVFKCHCKIITRLIYLHSGAYVWVAEDPLGPWTYTGVNINEPSIDGCARGIPAQNNGVFKVAAYNEDNGEIVDKYIFTADLWTTAPDGLKSHDLQYWQPLEFDDSVSPPSIAPLQWVDGFEIILTNTPINQNGSANNNVSTQTTPSYECWEKIQHNMASCRNHSKIDNMLLIPMIIVILCLAAGCMYLCYRCRKRCCCCFLYMCKNSTQPKQRAVTSGPKSIEMSARSSKLK